MPIRSEIDEQARASTARASIMRFACPGEHSIKDGVSRINTLPAYISTAIKTTVRPIGERVIDNYPYLPDIGFERMCHAAFVASASNATPALGRTL